MYRRLLFSFAHFFRDTTLILCLRGVLCKTGDSNMAQAFVFLCSFLRDTTSILCLPGEGVLCTIGDSNTAQAGNLVTGRVERLPAVPPALRRSPAGARL